MGGSNECQNYFGEPADGPYDCALDNLEEERRQQILDDVSRMLEEFSSSSVCTTLARRMQDGIGNVYETPDPFFIPPEHRREQDDSTALGDYHALSNGHPEQIHIANSLYFGDGPGMNSDDFTEVVRHEFAHAIGYGSTPATDYEAQNVATLYCGPGGSGDPGATPPKNQHPMVMTGNFTTMSTGLETWDY